MERVTYGMMCPQELPRLLKIYERCFGFPEEGRYALGEQNYLTQYAAYVGGIPAAMLSSLPGTVRAGKEEFPVAYLYGVATHPDFRGRGLCTGLMEYVHRELKKAGCAFTLLVPSNAKNRHFYAARGYRDCSSLCYGTFTAKEEPYCKAEPVDTAEYGSLRERFAPQNALLWGKEGLIFQQGWLSLYGGGFWRLGEKASPVGCAAVTREDEGFFVRELLAPAQEPDAVLAALCGELSTRSLRYALGEAQGRALGVPQTPLAMGYPLTAVPFPDECYINLVFD